jgi:hypothetical protein
MVAFEFPEKLLGRLECAAVLIVQSEHVVRDTVRSAELVKRRGSVRVDIG